MKNLISSIILLTGLAFWGFYACDDVEQPELCPAPTNLTVFYISPTEIGISWTAPPGVDSFQISVSPQPTPAGPFTTTGTSFIITGLKPDNLYNIEVRSFCGQDLSLPASASARTSTIIIVDIISQFSGSPAETVVDTVCGSQDTSLTFNGWNDAYQYEILRLKSNSADVAILKKFDTGSNKNNFYILREGILCDGGNTLFTVLNPPDGIISSTSTAVTLSGTGYTIEITNISATMTADNSSVTATIYR